MFKREEKKKDELKADSKESAQEAVAPEAEASSSTKEESPTDDKTSKSSEASQPAEPAKPAEPDWKDQYARLLADFDNYKKRAARDREDTYRYAEADILNDVLPAVDNLQLALDNAKDKAEDPFVKGVRLVFDTLLKSLKDHGAEPFDSLGQSLDVDKMEAIATLPSPDVEEGKVSNEVKRGWMLKGKVLRVAQVVVSSGKPEGKV